MTTKDLHAQKETIVPLEAQHQYNVLLEPTLIELTYGLLINAQYDPLGTFVLQDQLTQVYKYVLLVTTVHQELDRVLSILVQQVLMELVLGTKQILTVKTVLQEVDVHREVQQQ